MTPRVRVRHLAWLPVCLAFVSVGFADNTGDWYDNRDDDHAAIDHTIHPGLQRMSSGQGFQQSIFEGRVIVGNASLAYTQNPWGSLVRVNGLNFFGAQATYRLYTSNHAYWHPEHRDHDDKDHYHAMTPTVSNSQGSSGSELDELNKWFRTLAAFEPAVKERLREAGLLMPTLQMIFRRTRVASDDEYLSGIAHPSAFDNADNESAMVAMAAAMQSGDVPPMVQLRVLESDFDGRRGQDFFEASGSESLYVTPVSIAGIFRGHELTKRMVVSAAGSYDLNDRELSFHWRVLRGDPAAVRLTPRNDAESEVEIEIDYHSETTIEGSDRLTNLVVIGAFVHNGAHYSAPAFVTSFTLDSEERDYNESGRIREIRYNQGYVHPMLSLPKSWERDTFVYDALRRPRGWTRSRGSERWDFTADGKLVVEGSLLDGVRSVQRVRYVEDASSSRVLWEPVGSPTPVEETSDVEVLLAAEALGTATCAAPGQEIAVDVRVEGDCAVRATTFGIAIDPELVDSVAVDPSLAVSDLREGSGPELWQVDLSPDVTGCAASEDGSVVRRGIAVSMVSSFDTTDDEVLPAEGGVSIAQLRCSLRAVAASSSRIDFSFVSCLSSGVENHRTIVHCQSGPARIELSSASVTVAERCFERGDCNADSARDISDAVTALLQLFAGNPDLAALECLDACDANDDGAFDISDPMFLLRSLFEGLGGLGVCAPDLTADELGCDVSLSCS